MKLLFTCASDIRWCTSVGITCFACTNDCIWSLIVWTDSIGITSTIFHLTSIYWVWNDQVMWYCFSREHSLIRIFYLYKRQLNQHRCRHIQSCKCTKQHWFSDHVNRWHSGHIHHFSLRKHLSKNEWWVSWTSTWRNVPVQTTLGSGAVLVYPILQVQTTALVTFSWLHSALLSHPPFLTRHESDAWNVMLLLSHRSVTNKSNLPVHVTLVAVPVLV